MRRLRLSEPHHYGSRTGSLRRQQHARPPPRAGSAGSTTDDGPSAGRSLRRPRRREPTAARRPRPRSARRPDGIELPEVNPLEISGDIIVAGSSTVFPLTERMAERFRDEGYAGNITIDSIGTGAGFERFCVAGETDISNASRAIKDSEVESCRSIDREPVEFRVGTDALAVVVNPDNDWVGEEGVTVAELAKLFSSDVTNWSDVNPAWPAQPVKRFSPGTNSGTFDYFIEAVMDPAFPDAGEEALLAAANLQLSEDDNVLVQGVSGDQYAIGYFGFAYFEENAASAARPVRRRRRPHAPTPSTPASTRWPARSSSTLTPASWLPSPRSPTSSTST